MTKGEMLQQYVKNNYDVIQKSYKGSNAKRST